MFYFFFLFQFTFIPKTYATVSQQKKTNYILYIN